MIFKICKSHGELTQDQCYPKNKKCRLCQREWSKNNYINNKEIINKRRVKSLKIWRAENKEKVSENNKRYWKRGIEEVRPNYIKDMLIRKTNLNVSDIPMDLVEVQKNIILTKRKIKQMKEENGNN